MIQVTAENIESLRTQLADLDDDATCVICRNRWMIPCWSHLAGADGWCPTCDTPVDGGPAGRVCCPCQG